ncbi:N-acetylgalactosamine 6-sulfate sulfatase [Planctomycetales bacterium 10988]|nr:N-acetylgalactosamine 6-sulfate sulfatase [Planctomycetales bacterium 10988]
MLCVFARRVFQGPPQPCSLFLLSIVLFGSMLAPLTSQAEERPNVILIMTDDQGYGDMSCHGNPYLKTPAIDSLYRESIQLTDFHVDPTCSPTRSALMTGRYSPRTGVWHTVMGRSMLRKDEVTLADVFAENGYRTGMIGKWHLGDNHPFFPEERGFDYVLAHGGGGIGQTPDFWGNDYYDDVYYQGSVPVQEAGYCTDVFFEAATKFISAPQNKPFFCYLATNVPHSPRIVPEQYSKPYQDIPGVSAEFYGMLANFDENLGRLLKHLETTGLAENTILIFMTDNGSADGFYNAGMRGKKGSAYDGGHRVPCFIRWPSKFGRTPRAVDQITAHVDLFPTLLELCGLEEYDPPPRDGTSLVPLLEGKDDWKERTLFVQSHRIDHPEPWRQSAVMTQRWRLVDGKQLFDVSHDPGQKKDVAADHPEVVEQLRGEYEAYYRSVSERFDEYTSIILGTEANEPDHLTAHDWHTGKSLPPWNQDKVQQMPEVNGYWVVDVATPGKYRFTMRHFPAVEPKTLQATEARLQIGSQEVSTSVPENSDAVSFELFLNIAEEVRLMTWLDDGEVSRGAFFVDVVRLE